MKHHVAAPVSPVAKKRALHDLGRSAHGMLATTVAAEVDSSNGR
ncbi:MULTISPECIES: hypothetical protein [Rhizobium]|nr:MULTISPECIES: hypothetical protein [Rhizobium]